MSDLPQGWVTASVGTIADISSGFGFPERFQGKAIGEFPFAKVRDISFAFRNNKGHLSGADNYVSSADLIALKARPAPAGSTIFAKIGEALRLNRRVILDVDAILDNNCMAITPYNGAVDPRFLYRFMSTVDLSPFSVATTVPSVRRGDVESIEVKLPSLSEQRRIVAKIDSLTGKSRRARDHLDHIPRLVEKYKQAILAAAFRGDLTQEWREGHHLAVSRSVLLGEVAEGFNYGSAAKSAKEGRVPVLRMGNIQDGKLDWSDLVFTDDAAEIAKYGLKEGDVLFNRTNSPALVGKTALFSGEREAIYAGYLIKVRCKPELLPAFLTYCLNAPNGRAYSWDVKTDGVSQSNINAKKLAAFRFDLPSVEEQAEIVRRIEAALSWINRITVDANSGRKLIDHLDQSVLAKAFKGELVPQDPADEPASALLDRIRTERAAAPKAKRGRKKAA